MYSFVFDDLCSPRSIPAVIAMLIIDKEESECIWTSGKGHRHRRQMAWIAESGKGGLDMVDHSRVVTDFERTLRRLASRLCLRDAMLMITQKSSGLIS